MPGGKEPFDSAPDLNSAFEGARDDTHPNPDRNEAKAERPRPHLKPTGPLRGMAGEVDRRVQVEEQALRADGRKAGGEGQDRKPRRVARLAQSFRRAKDKGDEPER